MDTIESMKKVLRIITVAALALVTMSSCKSQFDKLVNSTDDELKYEKAFEYFNAGKYNKAAQLFESISITTNGTEREDTVQYYWGLSNYRNEDYYTAETNFTSFITSFPNSPFTSDATFMRVDCLYRSTLRYELDQKPTHKALSALAEYLNEFPDTPNLELCNAMISDLSERLDRKAYEAAKLYYKMEDYLAARVSFKNVLKDDSDNIYREDILYYTAMSSFKYAKNSVQEKQKERYMNYVDDYLNFVGEYPESLYRKELDALYQKAQKALGKYTGSDEDIKIKEKDFEKERRMLLKQESKEK